MTTEIHPDVRALFSAATAFDLERVRELVARGVDVNACDEYGETVLMVAIGNPDNADSALRLAVARELLSLGADPRKTDEDGSGPICQAAVRMDTEVLRLLMDAGANPNDETGWDEGRTAYDLAVEDYYVRTWLSADDIPIGSEGLPEEPDAHDLETQDSWLAYLDRIAVKYGKRRPDFLFLMRERGARCMSELTSTARI